QSSLWASGALEHLVSIFLILISLLAIKYKSTKFLMLSFLAAWLASFCQGNGIFCFAALALAFFMSKRIIPAAIFGLSFLISLFFFLKHPSALPQPDVEISSYPLYFLSFLGSVSSNRYLSVILGSFILACAIYFFTERKKLETTPLFILLL